MIVGSAFQGDCCWDPVQNECVELHEDIRYHINGNAIYNLKHKDFHDLIVSTRKRFKAYPFDVAIYMQLKRSPRHMRQAMNKYVYHPFITNMGTYQHAILAAETLMAALWSRFRWAKQALLLQRRSPRTEYLRAARSFFSSPPQLLIGKVG